MFNRLKTNKTIEQQTAETVLQQPETVVVGGRTYTFMPPTSATLIAASAAISKLPRVVLDSGDVVSEVLRIGRDCAPVGEAIAIFLVGAKGYFQNGKAFEEYEQRVKAMTIHLLEDVSPDDLITLGKALFSRQEVSSFFGLTAFLIEANMLRPTKAEETTASGQQ